MINRDDNVIISLSYLWTRITEYTFLSLRPQFTWDTLQDKRNTQLQRKQTQCRADITVGYETVILQ